MAHSVAVFLLLAAIATEFAKASLTSSSSLCFAGSFTGGPLKFRPSCFRVAGLRPAPGATGRAARYAAPKMSSMFTEDSNGEISVTPLWEDSLDDLDGMNVTPEENQRLIKARAALLTATAGLERGSSASREQRASVERAVEALERCLPYSPSIWPDCIQGSWRLIYSSAWSPGSGSGGGASKNSPFVFQTPDAGLLPKTFGPLSPIEIGSVFQDIDLNEAELDNVVDINIQVPVINSILPDTTSTTRLTLRHTVKFEPDYARRIRIVLKECKIQYEQGPIKTVSDMVGLNLPQLSAPVFQQITEYGPGIFDTSYCDDEVRISRGDRGELRVFVRVR